MHFSADVVHDAGDDLRAHLHRVLLGHAVRDRVRLGVVARHGVVPEQILKMIVKFRVEIRLKSTLAIKFIAKKPKIHSPRPLRSAAPRRLGRPAFHSHSSTRRTCSIEV